MSFLSIDQRKAALNQMDNHIALLEADIKALVEKVLELEQYKGAQRLGRDRVFQACEGELDADALITVDNVCRERLVYGIPHYPVAITSGQKVTVKGVWP